MQQVDCVDKDTSVKAAGYIRVSQERAARNGYSLSAQEDDIRRHAVYKQWELVAIYREEGVSGYERDRPALEQLLSAAKTGCFSVAIFPSIDRAGRSVKDVIDIDHELRSHGVEIVFLREGIDTSTPTGELYRNIMAAVAQFEGRLTHERLMKGRRRKAAEGGYIGGWVPYGYRITEDGKYALVSEQADIVRLIFLLRAQGKSMGWTARHLNEINAPTQNGGRWHVSTVMRILSNRFYTGRVVVEGQVFQGKHESIVSAGMFEAAKIL